MLILSPHVSYILASYGITMLVIATLIIWIVLDGRTQKRLLIELEKKGAHRRSDKTTEGQQTESIKTNDK